MKILLTLPCLLLAILCPAAEKKKIDFNRDIRPILSDKCFQCHGPDEESLKADLRLDHRSSAVDDIKSIIPGDADASELIFRITTDDDDDLMPPAKIKKPVTKAEITLLTQWIAEGCGIPRALVISIYQKSETAGSEATDMAEERDRSVCPRTPGIGEN